MDMSIRFPGLELTLDRVEKSVRILGFDVAIYGILIAAGMLLGAAFVVLEAKRLNQNQDMYLGMILVGMIGGLIGARLYYVAFNWSMFKSDPMEILDIRNGGMAIYGGILGAAIFAALFCEIRKLPFEQMADTASLGLLIGQIIGRWGDFFNRGSFGEYTDLVTAMQIPLSAVSADEVTSAMRENLVTIDEVLYIQVHPVFFYESALCLLLFLWLMAWRRRKKYQGEIFMRYLAGYGLIRAFTEWLRSDQLLIPVVRIPVSLVVSIALFVLFRLTIMVKRSMAKKREAFRKRRREQFYEDEEKEAAGYSDEWVIPSWKKAEMEREAAEKAEQERLAAENSAAAENIEQEDQEQSGSDEESEAEPIS